MRKLLFVFLFTCNWIMHTCGQSISSTTIVSDGDYFSNSNFNVSWSVGEIVTESFSNTNFTISQGFQQPSMLSTATEISTTNTAAEVFLVYPIPAHHFLHISATSIGSKTTKVMMYDLDGRRAEEKIVLSSTGDCILDISMLSSGLYILEILQDDGTLVHQLIQIDSN